MISEIFDNTTSCDPTGDAGNREADVDRITLPSSSYDFYSYINRHLPHDFVLITRDGEMYKVIIQL